jgi:RNA polymerase sigma factor for flagellar operon FliA
MPLEELEELLAEINGSFVVSLDELVHITEDSQFLLGETLADSGPGLVDEVERRERARILAEAVERLGERERTCISLFYYEGLTNKEVAEVMGVSPARVCFLHARALRKLKDSLTLKRLIEIEAPPPPQVRSA